MVASWRPDLWCGIAANADPNDPAILPVWAALTNQLVSASDIARGRQYELALTQAGEPTVVFDDPNEYLNPDNTGSPHYPNLVPYRQVCLLATWANPAAGNLFNSGLPGSPDPSFEAYTNGAAAPSWLVAVGGVAPTITTTTPQQGTKCATWTTAPANTAQGAQIRVRAVPGQQYTTSIYLRQSSATTQRLAIDGLLGAYDKFARTAADWGSATTHSSTLAYALTGTAGDFATNGTSGVITVSANASRRIASLATATVDFDIRADLSVNTMPATGSVSIGLVGRRVDADNMYWAELTIANTGAITLKIFSLVATVATLVDSLATGLTYVPGSTRTLRFQGVGSSLRCKMWLPATPEPDAWDVDTTDPNVTSAGGVGCYARDDSITTGKVFTFDNLLATSSATSSTTVTTGSYVRLSVTWTAQQPYHYAAVTTIGANVGGGAVLVDAFQHEPGASASAFTTSGSVIYPVLRDYIERYPSTWDWGGFRGRCEATLVDVMAVLANLPTHSEVFLQTMSLGPDLYYPLWEAEGSIYFGEATGNGGPYLRRNVSKYGAGVAPAAGTPSNVVGDPDGVGVAFTPEGDDTGTRQAATTIGTGPLVSNSQAVALPAVISTQWAMSASAFFTLSNTSGNGQIIFPFAMNNNVAFYVPIEIYVAATGTVRIQNYAAGVAYAASKNTSSSGITPNDGQPHHIVGVVTQAAGGNTTVTAYLDGVDCGTTTVTTASIGGTLGQEAVNLVIGGVETADTFLAIVDGVVSHVAVWNRALTAAEVTDLWSAGGLGWEGETTGARLARLFDAYYVGEVDFSAGRSVMSASSATESTTLLDIANRIAQTEDGVLWPAPDGVPTFEGRDDRYLRVTSTYTLGESTSGGEYPYQGDIAYDLDPTFIFNDVIVNQTDGLSIRAQSPLSQRAYFRRGAQQDMDLLDPLVAVDAVNWILATHKDPHRRVATLTLDPASYPTLWPVALSIEVGMRVTVVRRAKGANAGAGITVTYAFFVERVSHSFALGDDEACEWTTELLLSPAGGSGGYPQPWILDDATYSVLDSTTVAGF